MASAAKFAGKNASRTLHAIRVWYLSPNNDPSRSRFAHRENFKEGWEKSFTVLERVKLY